MSRPDTDSPKLSLNPHEIARLTREVKVVVTLEPNSGTSPKGDWWVVSIEELEIEAVREGLEKALDHLENLAVMAATEIIFNSSRRGEEMDDELLPLALRIWADHHLGRLSETLRSNETLGDESCLGHANAPE